MRYEKGNFTVIPNRNTLRGLPSHVQTVFFWLCSYSDNNGQCYPSRSKLSKDAGCSIRTVDTSISKLVEIGMLKKETRKAGKENLSNIYQIIIQGGSAGDAPPSATDAPGVVQEVRSNYNHSNYNQIRGNNKVVSYFIEVEDKKTTKAKSGKDKQALKLREWAYQQIEDTYGHYPVINQGDYFVLVKALKFLSEEDIKIMVEDALSKGEGQTVRSIFTDRQIDLYRQENI